MNIIKNFDFNVSSMLIVNMHNCSFERTKGITFINAFQTFFDEFNCKPDKIWVDKGSEFYNRSMKSWSQDNDIEMHSTHNEGKPATSKRFIRNLKHKN